MLTNPVIPKLTNREVEAIVVWKTKLLTNLEKPRTLDLHEEELTLCDTNVGAIEEINRTALILSPHGVLFPLGNLTQIVPSTQNANVGKLS